MLKEDYNKNRPKTECPICGKLITNACFNKHFQACVNPNSKYNLNKNKSVYKLDHEDLYCKFCNNKFQSTNALIQHEIRCKENPNRTAYQNLTNYIQKQRKGKTAENCVDVNKQRQTILDKYTKGYISPLRGKSRKVNHIYKQHNDNEINKWLKYISQNTFEIPKLEVIEHNTGYKVISKQQRTVNTTVYLTFAHNYIANILLNNELTPNNTVHHIDSDRCNNSPENLLVFIDSNNHKRFHNSNYAYITYNKQTHLFSCELIKPSTKNKITERRT